MRWKISNKINSNYNNVSRNAEKTTTQNQITHRVVGLATNENEVETALIGSERVWRWWSESHPTNKIEEYDRGQNDSQNHLNQINRAAFSNENIDHNWMPEAKNKIYAVKFIALMELYILASIRFSPTSDMIKMRTITQTRHNQPPYWGKFRWEVWHRKWETATEKRLVHRLGSQYPGNPKSYT